MKLTFLGSGDAFGSGGRFHTCFHVGAAESVFLIDCGASALIAMRRFGVDPNTIDTILISHLHGDHFGGLPFLLLDAHLVSRRTRPLTIAGPPGLRDRLHRVMEVLFPGSTGMTAKFPLDICEMTGRTTIGSLAVTPFPVRHAAGAPAYALRVETEGRTVAYSGDTEWTDALIAAARGADLFICEAYFYDKRVKYHLDYATLVQRLGEITAQRVILTHPSAELLARRGEVELEIAADGMTIDLDMGREAAHS
jgi:ribonuclease BN (tRNA processing enzyme)